MGLPLRRNDDDEPTDEFLIKELEELDERLHAIQHQVRARVQARARARAVHLGEDPRVRDLIADSAKRHANGQHGEPDAPELLNERLDRLTGS